MASPSAYSSEQPGDVGERTWWSTAARATLGLARTRPAGRCSARGTAPAARSACLPCRYATPASDESWWMTAMVSKRLDGTGRRTTAPSGRRPWPSSRRRSLSVEATLSSISAAVCIGGSLPPKVSGHAGDVAGAVDAVRAVGAAADLGRLGAGAVAGVAVADRCPSWAPRIDDARELRGVVVVRVDARERPELAASPSRCRSRRGACTASCSCRTSDTACRSPARRSSG